VQQTVEVIFEDPGVKELIVKLYHKGRQLNANLDWQRLQMLGSSRETLCLH